MKNAAKNHKQKLLRKGQAITEVMFILTEILLVIAAGIMVFNKLNSIQEDQLYAKKFYARDLALLMDTIESMEGNLLYFYKPLQTTLSKITFKFTKTTIEANDEKYPVASRHTEETTIDKPKTTLLLTKENNKITIQEIKQIKFNKNKINCPEIKTTITMPIIIDPGHGHNPTERGYQGETGFVGLQGKESEIMVDIATNLQANIKANLGTPNVQVDTTRSTTKTPEDARTTKERKQKTENAGVIISLHANKDTEENNNIKAYINYDSEKYYESAKLACIILNELSDTFTTQTTGAAIIPVLLSQLDNEEPKQILDSKKIAVQIELGNINSPTSYITKTAEIGNAITKALREYRR